MNRAFIEAVINKIKTDLPEFKMVELFNNQLDNQSQGSGKGVNFPAIFISFPESVEYVSSGQRVQRANEMIVSFIIASKVVTGKTDEILKVFDLKTKVYQSFLGVQGDISSSFTRIAEDTDEERENYYTFTQTYKTQLIDYDANRFRLLTEISGLDNLEVTPEI